MNKHSEALETHTRDKYNRTIGDVILPDGTNVNHELVKEGWCWWYRKYAPGDMVLEGLEKEAREAKIGLWADPQPVPPWEWRNRQGIGKQEIVPHLGPQVSWRMFLMTSKYN